VRVKLGYMRETPCLTSDVKQGQSAGKSAYFASQNTKIENKKSKAETSVEAKKNKYSSTFKNFAFCILNLASEASA